MTLEQLAALANDAKTATWQDIGSLSRAGFGLHKAAFIAASDPAVVAALVAEVMAWRLDADNNLEWTGTVAIDDARTRTDAALKGTAP